MLAPRRLWTGPPGAAIRDRLAGRAGRRSRRALWIVPTPLAARPGRVGALPAEQGGRAARAGLLLG